MQHTDRERHRHHDTQTDRQTDRQQAPDTFPSDRPDVFTRCRDNRVVARQCRGFNDILSVNISTQLRHTCLMSMTCTAPHCTDTVTDIDTGTVTDTVSNTVQHTHLYLSLLVGLYTELWCDHPVAELQQLKH